MEEKVYKTMESTGIFSLILGIITIVTGVSVGVLMLINAARLMSNKSKVLF